MKLTSKSLTLILTLLITLIINSNSYATAIKDQNIRLTEGIDETAGNVPAYIINTPSATYYLEKQGGGLSSMLDVNGIDWIAFNNEKGSGWKGEYRGFPNAIHKQDGNYFHALNAGTELSSSSVSIVTKQHIRIEFTSGNGKWQGQWDFYPDRCDFTMTKVSEGYHYWVLYEGVPNGSMDKTDFWFSSADKDTHLISEHHQGDLPYPEWIAFGDAKSTRMLYLLNHNDDNHSDEYVSRPYMTVFGFGRTGKNKFINSTQRFSLGFIESTHYSTVESKVHQLVKEPK